MVHGVSCFGLSEQKQSTSYNFKGFSKKIFKKQLLGAYSFNFDTFSH